MKSAALHWVAVVEKMFPYTDGVSSCHFMSYCRIFISFTVIKSTVPVRRVGGNVYPYPSTQGNIRRVGRGKPLSTISLLRQKRGGVVTVLWDTVDLLTSSTVPYGSPIRFHWKNHLRTEEHPLPQCAHTALALAPWGPAVPTGPQWTPPKRKWDCSPKGRHCYKDLGL